MYTITRGRLFDVRLLRYVMNDFGMQVCWVRRTCSFGKKLPTLSLGVEQNFCLNETIVIAFLKKKIDLKLCLCVVSLRH